MEHVVKYDIADAAIAEMKNMYMGLTIEGVADKVGLAKVHDARMDVKNHRVAVEHRRKELKKDALEWGRKVDAEATRLKEMLLPIETYLQTQEDQVTVEKKRLKVEQKRRREELIQRRIDAFAEYGAKLEISEAGELTEDQFQERLGEVKRSHEIEQARLAEEARIRAEQEEKERKRREEEEARLAAERAEMERLEAERKAEEEKLRTERDRLRREREEEDARIRKEQEEMEAQRREVEESKRRWEEEQRQKAELEQAKKEAAERAKREAEERAKREREEKERAEIKAKEEAAHQEALRPDKEKIIAFAENVVAAIPVPELSDPTAQYLFDDTYGQLMDLMRGLVDAARKL